ncbi:MAG: hypothetical protein PHS14_00095 [Elusimicrobia bacterium]|nr:hypothetical protein [Elusimicrobiota bacterium]
MSLPKPVFDAIVKEQNAAADAIRELISAARARHPGRKSPLCEEAAPQSRTYYIPCAAPAARFVLSERGRVVYAMCQPCADHNVRNRGCQDLGPTGAA